MKIIALKYLLFLCFFVFQLSVSGTYANVVQGERAKDTLGIIEVAQYQRNKLRAEKQYENFVFIKGISAYKKALAIMPENDTIKLEIAKGYYNINKLDSAYFWYNSVITKEEIVSDDTHYLNYAELLTSQARYDEAREWFLKYQVGHPQDKRVKERLTGLDMIVNYMKDSIRFEIFHEPYNSDTYDFSPSYHKNQILFVSARETSSSVQFLKPKYDWDKTYFLNLFVIDTTQEAQLFDKRIKSSYHEGPVSFYDNDTKVIFTRNNFTKAELSFHKSKLYVKGSQAEKSKEGINKLKLFYAEKQVNGSWTVPEELWFNSDEFSSGHPTVSKDGKRLYFSSDREGVKGKTDIFISKWSGDKWGKPINMGEKVNTEGSEMFPYVDEHDMLYYASDGLGGLGGLDVFKLDLGDPNSKPQNMGYPLNSAQDDFGMIIKDEGAKYTGYFSSNRLGGLGLDDIYRFNFLKSQGIPGKVIHLLTGEPLPEVNILAKNEQGETIGEIVSLEGGNFNFHYEWGQSYDISARRNGYTNDDLSLLANDYVDGDTIILKIMPEVLVVKGTVTEFESGDSLKAVKIIVKNLNTGEQFGMLTEADGRYSFIGKTQTSYRFLMKKYQYFSEQSEVNTGNQRTGEIIHDEELEKIVLGKPIELNDIHFDLAKWAIRPDAAVELDKFVLQLKENPYIIVELSTHTDSRGSDAYNLKLSDHRAKSCAEYVIKHGITQDRLEGNGYGETMLLNECDDGVKCSEEQHQRNRRAEFKVTGFLPEIELEEEQKMLWISPDYIAANMTSKDKEKVVLVHKGETGVKVFGKVIDEEGEPLVSALITVMINGNKNVIQVKSDAGGAFELQALPDMEYRIVAHKEGFKEEGIKVVFSVENNENKLDFVLVKKI